MLNLHLSRQLLPPQLPRCNFWSSKSGSCEQMEQLQHGR